jgi:3-hydroxybutyryl-CoA dehydrogenase
MSADKLKDLMGENGGSAPGQTRTDRLVVVGGGTMGQGICIAAARLGIEMLVIERGAEELQSSLAELSEKLNHEIARWAMTESEKKSIMSRIKGETSLAKITDQHYIIESVPDNLELKKRIFAELDKQCIADAIFITNTSTLSITEVASATNRPDRVIGMHFMNPVSKVRMVELVRGLNTSAETFQKTLALAERLERTAIEVYESPGYVTTRVMMPLVNEAIQVLMEGVASAEDIDTAVRIGYELPYGPLAMADQIGLDQVLNWLDTLFRDLGDPKYRPCPLLRMLVRAGNLGVKTGRGFFRYDSEGRAIPGSGQTSAAYKKLQ